jgi:hypothetical protein
VLAEIARVLSVMALSMVELWAGYAAAIALGLGPLMAALVSGCGAFLGVFLIAVFGQRLRVWVIDRFAGGEEGKRAARVAGLWKKYGIVGVGIVAPLVVGVPVATALGIGLGAPTAKLLSLMGVVIVFWCVVLAGATILGIHGFHSLVQRL